MASGGPILVTGIARAGTSWVGKMLEATGQFVYINEPLNPKHPPGQCPGILRARIPYEYLYISEENEREYREAFADMFSLRYHAIDEIKQNHTAFDVLKMAKYLTSFTVGRVRRKRSMLNDPYAVLSAEWLNQRFCRHIVVIVRQPAALVASYRRLGIRVDFRNLLEQSLLMRDHLEPFRAEMESMLQASDDLVGQVGVLWRVIHHVVAEYRLRVPQLHVVRHEDLSLDPVRGYAELFSALGLELGSEVRQEIIRGSSGSGSGGSRSHSWRLSRAGLLSRTAFRPMDSRANLDSWKLQVTPQEAVRIRRLTGEIGALYYADDEWEWLVGDDRDGPPPLRGKDRLPGPERAAAPTGDPGRGAPQ